MHPLNKIFTDLVRQRYYTHTLPNEANARLLETRLNQYIEDYENQLTSPIDSLEAYYWVSLGCMTAKPEEVVGHRVHYIGQYLPKQYTFQLLPVDELPSHCELGGWE
jgi:hypothetical protein